MQKNTNNISKFIPNAITILSLCCGLSSIRYSLLEEWRFAIFLIVLAAIFDFFDGWFARKLERYSNFGAELDSLSDFVSFGVSPALLIYFWTLNEINSLGWSITIFFAVCAALRLARFTADIYLTSKPIDSNTYFVGVPSPAAAGLCLLPLIIFTEYEIIFLKNPYFNFFNLGLIGFLMISKVPTISMKSIVFSKKTTPWIILLISIICISSISNIWLTLIIMAAVYILSIFYTIYLNIYSKN